MVKITESEFTDSDGNIRKVRKVEAAHARIEYKDGTVGEYSNCRAEKWPYSLQDSPAEWQVFGIPESAILRILNSRGVDAITILTSENGEALLRLVNIFMTEMRSKETQPGLIGTEEPLTNETPRIIP